MLKTRTASAGFSVNRIIKTPRDWAAGGNVSDPNGLCGDAALYVSDRALDDLSIGTTRDGFVLGVILWENFIIQNHIANVMLIKGKTGQQKYVANGDHLKLTGPPNTSPQYDFSDLANLHVYDLYYKVRTDAKAWWQMRSSSLSGEITLSLISDM